MDNIKISNIAVKLINLESYQNPEYAFRNTEWHTQYGYNNQVIFFRV